MDPFHGYAETNVDQNFDFFLSNFKDNGKWLDVNCYEQNGDICVRLAGMSLSMKSSLKLSTCLEKLNAALVAKECEKNGKLPVFIYIDAESISDPDKKEEIANTFGHVLGEKIKCSSLESSILPSPLQLQGKVILVTPHEVSTRLVQPIVYRS